MTTVTNTHRLLALAKFGLSLDELASRELDEPYCAHCYWPMRFCKCPIVVAPKATPGLLGVAGTFTTHKDPMSEPQEHGMHDALGRFVPDNLIKPIDRARHELVCELVQKAQEESDRLGKLKATMMGDIEAFVALSAERYEANLGGQKGNLTLISFDGRYKVQRQIQEHLVFDERLQVAKALIDECIQEWSAGSSSEIRALVEHAFQVNKEGKVSTSRVLGLRRLDITGKKWSEAMRAIGDSMGCAGSKAYLRFYERIGNTDAWRPISLDFAGV